MSMILQQQTFFLKKTSCICACVRACVCACVCACVRPCVRACLRACVCVRGCLSMSVGETGVGRDTFHFSSNSAEKIYDSNFELTRQ